MTVAESPLPGIRRRDTGSVAAGCLETVTTVQPAERHAIILLGAGDRVGRSDRVGWFQPAGAGRCHELLQSSPSSQSDFAHGLVDLVVTIAPMLSSVRCNCDRAGGRCIRSSATRRGSSYSRSRRQHLRARIRRRRLLVQWVTVSATRRPFRHLVDIEYAIDDPKNATLKALGSSAAPAEASRAGASDSRPVRRA